MITRSITRPIMRAILFVSLCVLTAVSAYADFDLKAALAAAEQTSGPDIIELPEGVTEVSETLKVPSHTTIRGQGMEHSEIYIAFRGTGLDFGQQSHVTFRDFAITHRADKPTYGGGGYALDGGRGNGSARNSKFNVFDGVWIHDTNSVGLTNYRGSDHWSVTNCRFERTGRAGMSGNSFRNCIIANNYFGETGDDGVGLNGAVINCTVTGNYFRKCGSVGVTPAAGIKCHGIGCLFDGNIFDECHTAISFQREVTTPDNMFNMNGASQYNIFSNNILTSINQREDFEVSQYKNVAGIKVKNADHVKITDNVIRAVTPGGKGRCPLWIDSSRNVESSGNTYIGTAVKFANGGDNQDVEFFRDTFLSLDGGADIRSHRLMQVGHSISVKNLIFDSCKFDSTIGCYMRTYKNTSVEVTFKYCRLCDPVRIGFPRMTLQPGQIKSIPITASRSKEYRGLRAHVRKGQQLQLKTNRYDQTVIATREHEAGDLLLEVQPFTLDRQLKNNLTWLEWGQSPPKSGTERIYYEAAKTSLVQLTQIENELPGIVENLR